MRNSRDLTMVNTTEGKGDNNGSTGESKNSHGSGDDEGERGEETENRPLTKDEIFAVLKNSRRRETLRYLEENGGNGELGTLAEQIAAEENGIDVREVSSTQRKRVYIGLYQVHLPKMDDIGVIEFNKHRGTVELTDAAQKLYPYLHFDPHEATEGATIEPVSKTLGAIRDRLTRDGED